MKEICIHEAKNWRRKFLKEKIYYSSNVESFVEAITMSSVTEVLQNIFPKDSNKQEVNVWRKKYITVVM